MAPAEEGQKLAPPQRPAHHRSSLRVDAMNLEYVLRQVEPGNRDRRKLG